MKEHFMVQTHTHTHTQTLKKNVSMNNNILLLGRNIIRTVYHFNVVFFIKQMWYNIGTFINKEEGYSYKLLLLKIIQVPP